MTYLKQIAIGVMALSASATLSACNSNTSSAQSSLPSLFDSPIEENFFADGAQYFAVNNGELTTRPTETRRPKLRTLKAYENFELSVEFWVDSDTNTGIYFHCADPNRINPEACYEVNIFDDIPEADLHTGSIMLIEPPLEMVKAAGQWSTMTISANNGHLVVTVNGVKTADLQNSKFTQGHIAVQYAENGQTFKMRNLTIKSL